MPAFSRRPSTSTLSPDCITIKGGLYEQIKKIYFDNLLVQFSLTTTLPPHDRVRVQLDNDNALESQLLKVQTENFGESPESLGADRVLDAACHYYLLESPSLPGDIFAEKESDTQRVAKRK